MEEIIPKVIADKISMIIDKMRNDIQRYSVLASNSSYGPTLRVIEQNLFQLSEKVLLLLKNYTILKISVVKREFITKQEFIDEVNYFCEQIESITFENSLKIYDTEVVFDETSIVFDTKWKDRIRTYVVTIKSILDDANIENERLRNSIFSKLNAFEKELDQTKTSLQKFEMAFVDITYAIGAGCKNLEPAYKLFYKVMKSFGKLTDIAEHPQLPPPDDNKLLPPPNDSKDDE